MICRLFGHDPVFFHITLPRRTFCRRCGKELS
jgi:hypothetical protein